MGGVRDSIARARREFFDGQGNVLEGWREAEVDHAQLVRASRTVFLGVGLVVLSEGGVMASHLIGRRIVAADENVVVGADQFLLVHQSLRVDGVLTLEGALRIL